MTVLTDGPVQEEAPILSHKKIAADHFKVTLKSPKAARGSKAGQFVHVLCRPSGVGTVPLLRRPLSLFDADPKKGTIDFIYKIVGTGTAALAQMPQGSKIDLLGPLGKPFSISKATGHAILVGGGVGIPPLYLLAKRLIKEKIKVTVLLGARTRKWVICENDFKKLGVETLVATDDGTAGFKGSVVTLLEKILKKSTRDTTLYICGPTRMMEAAAHLAHRLRVPAQVSLEERMGCAMGCCMGCVVEVATEKPGSHGRMQRVCTEGPVFDSEQILWSHGDAG